MQRQLKEHELWAIKVQRLIGITFSSFQELMDALQIYAKTMHAELDLLHKQLATYKANEAMKEEKKAKKK